MLEVLPLSGAQSVLSLRSSVVMSKHKLSPSHSTGSQPVDAARQFFDYNFLPVICKLKRDA